MHKPLPVYSQHGAETDQPYLDVACEKLLTGLGDPALFFWSHPPCVVIGRNQNPYAETDTGYLKQNSIPIVRRLSGGGAVYHDAGTLNVSLILPRSEENLCRLTDALTKALASMGINAEKSGRATQNSLSTGTISLTPSSTALCMISSSLSPFGRH